jgi:hypothetical protein
MVYVTLHCMIGSVLKGYTVCRNTAILLRCYWKTRAFKYVSLRGLYNIKTFNAVNVRQERKSMPW